MYSYIKGTLALTNPGYVILEASGIGYKIFIPQNILMKLPPQGRELILHVSHVVRESFQALYGFLIMEERDLFEELTSVSGIGPKIALSLIGHMTLSELHRAVMNRDIKHISTVPGIGKKLAERLIIEMRDKFAKSVFPHLAMDSTMNLGDDPQSKKIQDAMNALVNLGYNQNTAARAIQKSLDNTSGKSDLASLITDALKHV